MYKYDLHVHSAPSSACGKNTAAEMVKRYKELGFSGFVLTNHFYHGSSGVDRSLPWKEWVKEYSKDYYSALETAKNLDFDLLFGIEHPYSLGKECLVYGLSPEFLMENPQLKQEDIALWSKTVRENGGFIAYAHPFRDRFYIPNPYDMPDLSFVNGIECYNHCNTADDDERAVNAFKNSGKIIIAGGDKHATNFDTTYGIVTSERIKTIEHLIKTLKNNDFKLYLGE